MNTPAERAKSLLEIHQGSCFVSKFSDLVQPFKEMKAAGEVTMIEYIGGAVTGFIVRRKGFRLKQMPEELKKDTQPRA